MGAEATDELIAESVFDPTAITRPDPRLLSYYVVVSLLATVGLLPITLIILLPHYFKYHTLQYRFDDEGIAMSWGILFRREVHLTYRRMQDIHLTRNVVQRWMGLATVAVQTASGSSSPEVKIEGVLEASQLRDFLYSKMRGAHGDDGDGGDDLPAGEEALLLLNEILAALTSRAASIEETPDHERSS